MKDSTLMFVPALRIAMDKAEAAEERRALENALARAETLARIEAAFEAKINASKAARGEGPTKLSRAKREQLNELSEDQQEVQAEQMAAFDAATSAGESITALKAGLRTDVKFWSGAAKYTHPADMPVVEEFVNAKRELLMALDECLKSRATS
jgi:hypothetical protein